MSDVAIPGSDTLTLSRADLDAMIAAAVKEAIAAQMVPPGAGPMFEKPEEVLSHHDLPVTPEVAGLFNHVPRERWHWLASVDQVATAIRRGRPAAELATMFDAANGHGPELGPAVASLARSAA